MGSDDDWLGIWSPGFNDPTVMGWLITLAYLWTAWSCRRLAQVPEEKGPVAVRVVSGARQISRDPSSELATLERRYFGTLGAGLFFLGVNKQLDFQTAFFRLARATADALEVRSLKVGLQIAFATVLGVCLLLLGALLWIVARRLGRAARSAALGCAALLAFVLVRAVTFEKLLDGGLLRLVLFDSGLIEVAALAWIAFSLRQQRQRSRTRGKSG